MPDAAGNIKGISVPEFPWLRECECGCGRPVKGRFVRGHNARIHGAHGTPTYASWQSAKARTTNPRNAKWALYGGRGISMCARYLANFGAFLADMGEKPPDRTLDRIDTDGGYWCGWCPECRNAGRRFNLRWATPSEQALNRRLRPRPLAKPCGEADCERDHYAKGLCFNHYMRAFRRARRAA